MLQHLIKFLSVKQNFEQFWHVVPKDTLPPETLLILKDFQEWFKTHESLDQGFSTWFFQVQHPVLKPEKREMYQRILTDLETTELSPELERELVHTYLEQDYAARIQDITNQIQDGVGGSIQDVEALVLEYQHQYQKTQPEASYELQWDINSIMDSVKGTGSLRWRLDCLNKSCGPIGKGDFIAVAARPDTGKTRFLIGEVTYMAQQLPDSAPVLWINNEERGEKVQSRIISATTGLTKAQVERDRTSAWKEYVRVQRVPDKIKVLDQKEIEFTIPEIENMIKRYKPGLVVIDQLWTVPYNKSGISDVGVQTYLASNARRLAKKYEVPVIGVYQLDGAAEGEKYPNMNHLYFSKTAVQTFTDLMLFIGRTYEFGQEKTRFLSSPKNKLESQDDESMYSVQHEVIINAGISRFEEPENV